MTIIIIDRIKRHSILAGITGLVIVFFSHVLDTYNLVFILSMSTAYAGMIFIAVTLILGPLNILFNKTNPISTCLRRDIGIWAGMLSVTHVIFGLQRHFDGKFWLYFVRVAEQGQGFTLHYDVFGLSNYSGLIATLICITLLVLSNNMSLKMLGAARWKNIQRYNYVLFFLVFIHGILFQLSVERSWEYVMTVGLIFIVVMGFQWKGYKLRAQV